MQKLRAMRSRGGADRGDAWRRKSGHGDKGKKEKRKEQEKKNAKKKNSKFDIGKNFLLGVRVSYRTYQVPTVLRYSRSAERVPGFENITVHHTHTHQW